MPAHRTRLKLVFMGTPPFAATCLERLLAESADIPLVVTRADKPRGRGMELQPSAVKELALRRGIEVMTPATAKDPAFAARLREVAPDLGVVVAYGRILPPDVLSAPRLGCINAHASLLPKLRGAAPIERAILIGFSETGVSIMRINERLDAGDVMRERAVAIGARTDAAALRETLAGVAADLLVESVAALADGSARFTPQDESQATYAPPLAKGEALVDWSADATAVDRHVRGFAPSPGAFTFDAGRRMKVLRGRALDERVESAPGSIVRVDADGVVVACGRGAYLVEIVQPEGKRPMPALAWSRGGGGAAGKRFDARA